MKRLVVIPLLIWALPFALPLWAATTNPLPDLSIAELSVTRVSTQHSALRISITIRVVNKSAVEVSDCLVRLSAKMNQGRPWETLREFQTGHLAPGGNFRWEQSFDFAEGGECSFKAEADPANQIVESTKSNNSKAVNKTLLTGAPDLIISHLISTIQESGQPGSLQVNVEWDVENIGDEHAETGTITTVYVSKDGGDFIIMRRFPTGQILRGTRLHQTCRQDFIDIQTLRFKVVTDDTNRLTEQDETNNTSFSETLRKRR